MTIVEIVIVFVVSTAAESIHVTRRRRRMRQRHVTSWYWTEHRDPRDAAPVDASVFAAALARIGQEISIIRMECKLESS